MATKLTPKDFVEALKDWSILDVVEAVKAIEDEFGIKAAAPVAVAAAPAAGGGGAAAATATGAAALMPNSSSMAFTASTTSRMLHSLSASTKSFGVILVAMTTLPPTSLCMRSALRRAAAQGSA